MPEDANFLHKLKNITRFFRQACKQKTRDNRIVKLNSKAKVKVVIANPHENIYSFEKQREVNRLKNIMDSIETRKAKGAGIRSRIKWQQVGDRCSKEFFQSMRQKTHIW